VQKKKEIGHSEWETIDKLWGRVQIPIVLLQIRRGVISSRGLLILQVESNGIVPSQYVRQMYSLDRTRLIAHLTCRTNIDSDILAS